MNLVKYLLIGAAALAVACSAKDKSAAAGSAAPKAEPSVAFCADSAYAYVAAQTAFGPRVPGSEASRRCALWLEQTLRRFGADTVIVSASPVTAYDGTRLPATNIAASFNSEAPARVLLLAHWDSRPWADHDPDPQRRMQPIDGANDGASGVGVILEIARCLKQNGITAGVDVLFVDAEDYGHREGDDSHAEGDDSWCLGTQAWLKNPTLDLDKIKYAVLLDMVGGKDATFGHEYHSQLYAAEVNDRLMQAARRAGEAARFPDRITGGIIDDHVYLLRAGVPAIDIIECDNPQTGSFNPTWHTSADNITNIDPATLGAVGRTVTHMIK